MRHVAFQHFSRQQRISFQFATAEFVPLTSLIKVTKTIAVPAKANSLIAGPRGPKFYDMLMGGGSQRRGGGGGGDGSELRILAITFYSVSQLH